MSAEIDYGNRIHWAWVDTCCIDKRSSAELSESINAMWKWYTAATYCVAYLMDVNTIPSDQNMLDQLKQSQWFQRGWTLQELLAPCEVRFCNISWELIGTKQNFIGMEPDAAFLDAISTATGIDRNTLDGTMSVKDACFAKKVSWSSLRRTTREEDRQCCC